MANLQVAKNLKKNLQLTLIAVALLVHAVQIVEHPIVVVVVNK